MGKGYKENVIPKPMFAYWETVVLYGREWEWYTRRTLYPNPCLHIGKRLCCMVGNGDGIRGERYPSDSISEGDGISWEMTISCLPVSPISKLISSSTNCLVPTGVDLGYNSCSQIYYPNTRIGMMNQIYLNL